MNGTDDRQSQTTTCDWCEGTGWMRHPDDPTGRCTKCGGSGGIVMDEPHSQSTLEAPASPDGLRARAGMVEGKLNDSGSCAAHLRSAANEIERLRAEVARLERYAATEIPQDGKWLP